MIYKFGERLTEISQEEWEKEKCPAVFLTDSNHAEETLAIAGIVYEAEIQIAKIGFCKIENQQECMVGTFCIPKLLDVLGSRYRMYMFVNENNVVSGLLIESRENECIRARRKNVSSIITLQNS